MSPSVVASCRGRRIGGRCRQPCVSQATLGHCPKVVKSKRAARPSPSSTYKLHLESSSWRKLMPEAVTTLSIYRRQEQPREGCRRMPDGNTLAACRSSSWPGTRSFPKGSTDPTKKLFNGQILLCSLIVVGIIGFIKWFGNPRRTPPPSCPSRCGERSTLATNLSVICLLLLCLSCR